METKDIADALPVTEPSWIQNEEPATGTSVPGFPNGVLNRPLGEVFQNQQDIRERLEAVLQEFRSLADILTTFVGVEQDSDGLTALVTGDGTPGFDGAGFFDFGATLAGGLLKVDSQMTLAASTDSKTDVVASLTLDVSRSQTFLFLVGVETGGDGSEDAVLSLQSILSGGNPVVHENFSMGRDQKSATFFSTATLGAGIYEVTAPLTSGDDVTLTKFKITALAIGEI